MFMNRITISGGGSWATALTKIFAESGVKVCWHLRSEEHVARLLEKGRNPNYLSYLPLPMEHIHPVSRSEEHTSELQSLMRISYAVFCLKKKIRMADY